MLRESPLSAPFLALADHFADAVEPANFPEQVLRFRNRRWANAIGLDDLDDREWLQHFGRFDPLPGNLPQPLAMRYHGHQFGTYNPQLGDGRGFLYAQVRGPHGRLHPGANDPDMATKAVNLLGHITRATASMIGQWMAAGFVHGVMNTDNFNITGETFDFGPWRFLPVSDPNFTAAYFDENGLYRFGRQPTQGAWALQQLASALLPLAEADDLARGLAPYEAAYQQAFAAHTHLLLGLEGSGELGADLAFLQGFYGWMTTSGASWPQTFFDLYGGTASEPRMKTSPQAGLYRAEAFVPIREFLAARAPKHAERLSLPYFQAAAPVTMLIEDVEALWDPIAAEDDWSAFDAKMEHMEAARLALAP